MYPWTIWMPGVALFYTKPCHPNCSPLAFLFSPWLQPCIGLSAHRCWEVHPHIGAETKWPTFYRRQFQIFLMKMFSILIKISLKFDLEVSIDYKSALFQVMAWYIQGNKSLPEALMTQFTDVIMSRSHQLHIYIWNKREFQVCHQASMGRRIPESTCLYVIHIFGCCRWGLL